MINGAILVGGVERRSARTFRSVNPATGEVQGASFSIAGPGDVADAAQTAEEAFAAFGFSSPEERARLLEAIGHEILGVGQDLIDVAHSETGLPITRLEGERGRTVGQLGLFAAALRRGEFLDVVIERAQTDRIPVPRRDLRRYHAPLGPVAVFGASNFPLAFSVAGGDTASALAAGCPVVVKGHPAHPGTGELVARAVGRALEGQSLPGGVFSFLPGPDHALGEGLVRDPRIKAVGFTGSRAGGLALQAVAAQRPEPIPVFAEMSSVNPVVILRGALVEDPVTLAADYIQSLTLGAGQFCTNPGLIFALRGSALDQFAAAAADKILASAPQLMLSPAITSAYEAGVGRIAAFAGVRTLAASVSPQESVGTASPALFIVSGEDLARTPGLTDEIFGPAGLIVECADEPEILRLVLGLEGQLTATLHAAPSDADWASHLLPALASRAGRVLYNGWPTGVEVCEAMVHGGPYPSTTDGGRSTSVGTLALQRFLRPVCYQDVPESLLPPPLRDDNPWKAPRRIDGVRWP